MMPDLQKVIPLLVHHQVRFIVIGGVAANLHGSARVTYDLDFAYARDNENLLRLTEALGPFSPYLRGAPPGLPFKFDLQTLRNGLNFTLVTTLGDIDLLGEVTGGGRYEDLIPHSVEVEGLGVRFRCLTVAKLIEVKNAAGRPKDLEALAELRSILEESAENNPTDKS